MQSHNTITLIGSKEAADPSVEVTIPRELGPVRLLHEIGRGGMGVVYLGRHRMLDRDVAVKFLLHAVAGPDDPGFAGFLEGTRAAARVEHPGLTTIHHADVVDGIPYLVMQYIDGPSLGDVLKQTGPLSLSALFAVLDAVSEAIGELHDREIVHRDIKPANILLDREGRVVVTDFGLALARPMGQRGPSSARLGGTPVYMAPEMFTGEVSLRSDVYTLGIMTFELVTGELPFAGTLEEVREKHLHEPLPLEPLQRRRLDPAMIEVLERATRKNAMFRYKSAQHFRSALKSGIMTDELLREGVADLQRLVSRTLDTKPHATTTEAAGTTPTSTYFDRLAEIAEAKRAMRELSDKGDAHEPTQEDREEPPPLPPDDEPVEVGSIPGPPSTEPAPASWPASAAALVADVPCAKCDYNLRGLSASGRCPECGEPIASSLRPDRLLFANPDWLRHIVRGLRVLYFAVPVWLLLFNLVVGPVLLVLSPNRKGALALARDVAVVVLIVGLVLGFFFATAAEPRRYSGSIRWSSRRVARTLGILIPLLLPAIAFTASYSRVLFIVSQGLICVALLGMIVTFLLYLASLVDRIPDARLARRSRVSAVLFPAFVTLGVALAFALWALNESPWGYEIGVALSICVVGCAVTVCLIWSLMRLYRKGIKRVIAASVSYETLFGDVPTEVALPTSENDRVATRSPRAETGNAGREGTDVDEVPSSHDVPCIHCGYNLRGLSEGGRCPECGTPIAQSSRGNLLSAADPAWLKRVDRGQTLIAAACMTVGILGFIQGDAVRAGPAAFIQPSLFVGPNTVKSVFCGVMFVAGNLVLLLGAFTVTTLDPRLSLTEQPIALRRFVRWSIAALMVLVVCAYLAPSGLKELGVDTELASLCGSAFRYVSAAVFLSALVGICYYLAGLAMRIPDARLAWRIRSRVIGFVVCLVICPVGTQVLVYGERAFAGTAGVAVIIMVIMIVVQVILMVFMCAYMGVLIYVMSAYQKAFRKCLLEARKYAGVQERSSGIIRTIGRWLFWGERGS